MACFRWRCIPITQSCHLHYCAPTPTPNYWTTNNTYAFVIVILTGYHDTPLGVCCPTFQHCALASTSTCPITNSESFSLHWTSNPLSSGHYMVLKCWATNVQWPQHCSKSEMHHFKCAKTQKWNRGIARTLSVQWMKTVSKCELALHIIWAANSTVFLSHALAIHFATKVISNHDYWQIMSQNINYNSTMQPIVQRFLSP